MPGQSVSGWTPDVLEGLMKIRNWTLGFAGLVLALSGCRTDGGAGILETVSHDTDNTNAPFSCSGDVPSSGFAFGGTAGARAAPAMTGPGVHNLSQVQVQEVPPPPVSGGTLAVTPDGLTAVAADPDRDQVYLVDLQTQEVRQVFLEVGDEPGRVALDDRGHADVALRSGGGIATIDMASGTVQERRTVCDLPRGIAYDPIEESIHVGCYEGRVVSLPTAGGEPMRDLELPLGVRDIEVRRDTLRVSRFRDSELLTVDKGTGTVMASQQPARLALEQFDGCQRVVKRFEPALAWRTASAPDGSTFVLHQRQQTTEVSTSSGGYGSSSFCDSGVVQTAVTRDMEGGEPISAAVPGMVMAVDMAVDRDGSRVAVAGPGNAGFGDQVAVLDMDTFMGQAMPELPAAMGAGDQMGCAHHSAGPGWIDGEVTAVEFGADGALLVQTREPARLRVYGRGASAPSSTFTLSLDSRADTGHSLFHRNSGGGIACASCHAEGADDANVWHFSGFGERRTQDISGGLKGTEPLHWQGDMADFTMLVQEVFVGRMSGAHLDSHQITSLVDWIDRQPSLKRTPSDALAVERGRHLFESPEVGCADCHSGALLTNNATVDVGTGEPLQVPSLKGLTFRAPFIHDGCAETLMDRFTECGGGDRHGRTSHLDGAELADLVSYLESL